MKSCLITTCSSLLVLVVSVLSVSQAQAYVLSIEPPTTLALTDGPNGLVPITAGTINLTGLTGYSQLQPGGFTILDQLDALDDVARDAEINSGVKMGLVEVDAEFEVLHFQGFFSSPVLQFDAFFEGIVGVVGPSGPDDFTIYLPANTTQPIKTQLTDLALEPMIDNNDVFIDVVALNTPSLQISPTLGGLPAGIEVFTLTGDPLNNRPDWYVGIGGTTDPGGSSGGGGTATQSLATANMNLHGTGASGGCIPGSLCTAIWNGGAGDWNTPGNWDIGLVPFNGNFGGSTFNVLIDNGAGGNSDVTLTNSVEIVSLTISGGDSLAIDDARTLTINGGTIASSGSITVLGDPSLGASTLGIPSSTTTTLSGGGEVILTHETMSRLGTSTNQDLDNVDNTIRGAGTIWATVTNQSLIRAEGGKLSINAPVDNTAGLIEVAFDGDLTMTRIVGGDLDAHGLSTILGTLENVTNIGDLTVQDATSLNLDGALTNQTTVTVLGDPSFGASTLGIPSGTTTTLNGGGEVILTHETMSRLGTSTNQDLDNVDNTIRGAGTIWASVTNQSLIRAEGGKLTLNGAVDNTGGVIEVAADGSLGGSATITNGSLVATDGSILMGPTIVSGVVTGDLDATSGGLTDSTLALGGSIDVLDAGTVTMSGALSNQGVITVMGDPSFGAATMGIPNSSTLTLNGGGEVVLTHETLSRLGTNTGQVLDNVDNTIRGVGTVWASVTNQSLIRAEGGTLTFNAEVDNTTGLVEVAADGVLNVPAGLVGGTLTSDPLGTVQGRLKNVTNTGPLAVRDGLTLTMDTSMTNQGVITILGSPSFGTATLGIPNSSTLTLNGGGELLLTHVTSSRIGTNTGQVLDNVDNTIRGQGTVWASVTNQSLIRAEGGTLTFNAEVDNTNGVVQIAPDGLLNSAGTLVGGTLTSEAGGTVSGTLRNVTGSGLTIRDGTTLTLDTAFTNLDTLTIQGDPSFGTATLGIPNSSTVILDGGGDVVMTHATSSRIGTNSGQILDNVDNTIRGLGSITAQVINRATLRAEGGTLALNGQVDNSVGLVEIAADGTLNAAAKLVGGTLTSDPLGTVLGTLDGVTNTGPLAIRDGRTLTIENSFTNQGTLTILGQPAFGSATLGIPNSSTVVLDGGGDVVLTHATSSRIGTNSGQVMDNVDNTIRGLGAITAQLINRGTLRAQGGTLTINGDVTGTGDSFVDAGATLRVQSPLFEQQSLTIDPAGTFDFNGTRLEVVDFNGDFIHDSGTFAPGSSPAESSLSGGYTQANTNVILEIEIGGTALGEFDQLTVDGAVDLNGKLSIVTLPEYVPTQGDSFVVLKALGGLTGGFSAIDGLVIGQGPGPGYQVTVDLSAGEVVLQTVLPGDLNGDGFVGIDDLNLVLANWNQTIPPGNPLADPSGDGFVGISDLNVILGNWNGDFPPVGSVTPPDAAIPEPSLFGLMGLGGLGLIGRRRA